MQNELVIMKRESQNIKDYPVFLDNKVSRSKLNVPPRYYYSNMSSVDNASPLNKNVYNSQGFHQRPISTKSTEVKRFANIGA